MQHAKDENFGFHYYSNRLKKKMKLLAVAKATIIEAPSGYGKTTAMRDFLKEMVLNNDDVYMFNAIDEEAPSVLYRRLCREIEKIDNRAGERLLEIDFPNMFTIGEVCDTLRLIRCNKKTWLVIDDFQFLFANLPKSFLSTLLDNDNEHLRIVIITQVLGQDFQKAVLRLGIPYITSSDLQWDADDIRSYFRLIGVEISESEANEVFKLTGGWIIAVYLQLRSYIESETFSDEAVLQLMEYLVWDKMTADQQDFFMRLSVFESCTLMRLCGMLGFDTMPDYAASSISIPFIRYIPETKLCVPHTMLREMVCVKRGEQGELFENECFLKAGDICRDEGEIAEAVFFYAHIKDYRCMLSLNLSNLICEEVGDRTFQEIALEIALNCNTELKNEFPHSMLCVAWAVRFTGNEKVFNKLMEELDCILPESGHLRAEWLLLSVYLDFPHLEKMLSAVKKASVMFDGACSSVILPDVPWAFYEYIQLATFHIKVGAADEEAVLFEKFMDIYSMITGGHGSGADALFSAELAFFRCETEQAEIFAHKAVFQSESKQQKNIQIGAARLLAVIAMLKSDFDGWQRVVHDIEHAAFGSVSNTSMFRLMLDLVHASLMAQHREYDRIADWLKNTGFLSLQLPVAIYTKAVEMHGYYLMGKGEYAQLVGFLQTIPVKDYAPFPAHFHLLTVAVGYSSLKNIEQAFKCVELSAKKALPDNMLHCYVGFSRLLGGLSDEFIKRRYPDFITDFENYKERYFTGWSTLYKALSQTELPAVLTERELDVAELAADGLRNNEIAQTLFLSEHTVRAHLRSVYQKLDIDRRAKLVKILK